MPRAVRSSSVPSPSMANSGRSTKGMGSVSPTTATSIASRSSAFFEPKPL